MTEAAHEEAPIPAGWELEPEPSVNIVGLCHLCARRGDNPLVCAAYEDGIPWGILTGDIDHRKPYEGDHGLQFSPASFFPLDRPYDPKDPPDNHFFENGD